MSELREAHADELESTRSDLEGRLEELIDGMDGVQDEVERVSEAFMLRVGDLSQRFLKSLDGMRRSAEETREAQGKLHQEEVATIRKEHADAMEAMRTEHADAVK
eukprot:3142354-Rhodomonas_salina.1